MQMEAREGHWMSSSNTLHYSLVMRSFTVLVWYCGPGTQGPHVGEASTFVHWTLSPASLLWFKTNTVLPNSCLLLSHFLVNFTLSYRLATINSFL